MLKAYLANRASADETFLAFSRRHDGESLKKMADAETDMNQTPGRRGSYHSRKCAVLAAQRSWLNGFLVGLLQLDGSAAVAGAGRCRPVAGVRRRRWRRRRALARPDHADCRTHEARRGASAAATHDGGDGAAGLRPVRLQLQRLFRCDRGESEARLNLCVPGGKETARMLKALHEELEKRRPAPRRRSSPPRPAPSRRPGRSRDNPVPATFVSRRLLNKTGRRSRPGTSNSISAAAASTMSSAISSASSPATRSVGHVDQIIALLGARTPAMARRFRDVLIDDVSLAPAPDKLFELLSFITGGAQREKARALAQGEDPDGDAATLDVMAALQKFSGVRPHPEAFVEALEPLQPRLYSISSSQYATPGKLSLTVDACAM